MGGGWAVATSAPPPRLSGGHSRLPTQDPCCPRPGSPTSPALVTTGGGGLSLDSPRRSLERWQGAEGHNLLGGADVRTELLGGASAHLTPFTFWGWTQRSQSGKLPALAGAVKKQVSDWGGGGGGAPHLVVGSRPQGAGSGLEERSGEEPGVFLTGGLCDV